jgi:hypothetical protein
MRNIILLILICLAVTSCKGQIFSSKSIMAPKPFKMGGPPKDSHPDYLEGWNAGCNTGLSTMVPGYYKSFYAFEQDPYKSNNPMYYKAWQDSYHYCRQYAFRFVWDSYDKSGHKTDNNICVLCPNELR